jgi:hypothetical protein
MRMVYVKGATSVPYVFYREDDYLVPTVEL